MKNSIFNAVCKTRYLALLVLLIFTCGNAWGDALTTAELNFGSAAETVNFEDVDLSSPKAIAGTGSGTQTSAALTGFGGITHYYIGKPTTTKLSILAAATPMESKYMQLESTTSGISAGFTRTFATTGVFRFMVANTSVGYIGLYATLPNNNTVYAKANSSVYLNFTGSAIQINNGSGWIEAVGSTAFSALPALFEVTVIYNNTNDGTTYNGGNTSLGAKRAHVFVNGTAVMNGDAPKEFTIPGATLSSFRVAYNGAGTVFKVDDIKIYDALPTAGSCTAPSSVTVAPTSEAGNYGWRYSTGQTIKLTASASGGSGGSYTYQWQKYVGSDWENLTNGGSVSGATSANLVISNCTSSNGGSYRCAVSTGATCTTNSDGYFVRVFTFNGNYSGSGFSENAITWTGENTGTVTLSLTESSIYEFKVYDNDGKIFGNGANNYIVQPVSWDCGTGNSNCRLFTGPAGNYTFTLNISHAGDNSPYVNVQVAYPTVTHPVEGYAYVSKWWDCYVHWWYNDGSDHALTSWGSDPQITTYADVCGTNYWYFPVLHTYNKLIVKNNAGDATSGNTSGDQTTDSHSGKYLTHDGVSWGWHDFTFYEIDFDGNGSDGGSMTDVTGICPNDSRTLATNNYSRTGYTFTGWNTQAGGGGTSYANLATISSINADIDLYAQWSAKTISITLDKNNNDASGSSSGSTSIKYDATAVLSSPTHATRTGYTLEGYYAEVGCTNKVMTSAGALVNYSGYVESGKWVRDVTPTTLYAKWTPIPYTVTWYVEGTELTGLAAGLTTVNYGSKVTGVPSPPVSSCEGTFVGWTTSADAVYNKNVTDNYTTVPTTFTTYSGSPTITGNTAFYAVFKKYKED